jgi:MGT family glycosyltransferase
LARFLAYTYPAVGHLYPLVETVLELQKRGHEVEVRTLGTEIDALEKVGIAATAVDPGIDALEVDEWRAKTPVGMVRRMLEVRAGQARLAIDDMRAELERADPDALIVDVHAIGAAFAAEASGLPWGMYEVSVPQLRSRDAPPFGAGWAPRRDLVGRFRDAAIRGVERLTIEPAARRRFNPLREELGLAPQRDTTDLGLAAGLLVCFTAEPFEYPRSDWPEAVRLVGPGRWDPPAQAPPWLDSIKRPLVLVSVSTDFAREGRLIEDALEGLAGEDVEVVATSGALDPAGFKAPANARVERFVPHGPMLAKASCVVCHGGLGIVQKALAAGVPVCAIPFGRDHLDGARRVEVCGAGTRLPPQRLSPERLRDAVREALGKRQGAERIAAAFAAAGGPAAAADAFEELLPA